MNKLEIAVGIIILAAIVVPSVQEIFHKRFIKSYRKYL